MNHTSPRTIALLALLALLPLGRSLAQEEVPYGDTLIERSLRMVDLPRYDGELDPLRPRLGIYVNPVPADSFALIPGFPKDAKAANRIWHVMPHWSADDGGMLIGDIILAINGGPLSDSLYAYDEFVNMKVREMRPGETARFTVLRDGAVRELRVPVTAPSYVPMTYFNNTADPRNSMFGATRKDTWLQRTLDGLNQMEWARTIQKQMRMVADQDFCTVPFAGRPNPWRLDAVTYLHNNPTHVGAYARALTDRLWNGMREEGLRGLAEAGALELDRYPVYFRRLVLGSRKEDDGSDYLLDRDAISTTKDLVDYLDMLQRDLDTAYAPVRKDLDSLAPRLMRMLDMENNWEGELDSVKDATARRAARNREEARLAGLLGTVDKVNFEMLLGVGAYVAALGDSAWLADFARRAEREPKRRATRTDGVEGEIISIWDTPLGRCVIGGKGPNRYSGSFRLVIDLGGDDVYDLAEPRPGTIRVVADIAGNDIYRSAGSGQGAGVAGVDLLADLGGDDSYRAARFAQGAGLLGVGVLADWGGNDTYASRWCSQGAAFQGIGLLFDGGGDDSYTADVYAQGFGYVRGFGAIVERGGNDTYRAGWKYADNRIPHKGYLAMSQGFGYGMRPWSTGIGADGGVGVLADLHGDDLYASDFFSQGGSYWYALGVLHDAEGTDRYTSGQYAQGSGIHLSFGALLDDEGDDTYDAYAGLEQGNAHDWSAGCLEDRAGNDTYRGSNSSQGSALNVSIAWLLDGAGNDQYYALTADSTLSQGGGNVNRPRRSGALGMLLDLGSGADFYVDPRARPGVPVVKGNGILFDDGPAAKERAP